MRFRKWMMKQQWRITQIRSIWGLLSGIMVLAGLYVVYFPFLVDLGFAGPLFLAIAITFGFLIIGYIYDKVLIMWAPSQEVAVERNPFQYVPSPKDEIFWFPLYSSMLDALSSLSDKLDIDKTDIIEVKEYYSKLQKFKPERRNDLDEAITLCNEFLEAHPFVKQEFHVESE
jgi:hypothetical protein